MSKKSEMNNKKFGKLVVLGEHSKTRNGHIRYECMCECGNKVNILGTHLRQGNTKSCGCLSPKGSDRVQWTGVGEISGDFWYNHIRGSKGRKQIELTITKEYVWDLFIKQNRKCSLSGIDLRFPIKHKDKTYTASLDRIDSSKGYIEGNVQWVHKDINMMKRIYTQEHFIKMCKLVAKYNWDELDGIIISN